MLLDLIILVEFLESLEPDLPALRAMGLHLWATGPEAHLAGISNLLSEAAAQVDEPVPGYLSAPQSMMDTCLYIFTSGTTGEMPRQSWEGLERGLSGHSGHHPRQFRSFHSPNYLLFQDMGLLS